MTAVNQADLSRLTPENTALLIIDMSNDFLAQGAPFETPEGRAMVPELSRLADRCREVGLRVIHVNHVHHPGAQDMGSLGERFSVISEGKALKGGTPGVEIWPELGPKPGDIVVEKIRQSGFVFTRLDATLRELGVQNLLVSGVSVGACVECTARDGVARDYHVIMLSDGTASSGLPDQGWGEVDPDQLQRVFLSNWTYHFGQVASIEEVLGKLAEPAREKLS